MDVRDKVRNFLLTEFLPGESPELLTDNTPLITGGILDSIATMKLAMFLEDQFQIHVEAHEMSVDHVNTVAEIVNFVNSKRSG